MSGYLMTWRQNPYDQPLVVDFGAGDFPKPGKLIWLGLLQECRVIHAYERGTKMLYQVALNNSLLDSWIEISPLCHANMRDLYEDGAFNYSRMDASGCPKTVQRHYRKREDAVEDVNFFTRLETYHRDVGYVIVPIKYNGRHKVATQIRVSKRFLKTMVSKGCAVYQERKWYGLEGVA